MERNEFGTFTWHVTGPIISTAYDRDTGCVRIVYKALSPNPLVDTFVVEISPTALPELLSFFHQLETDEAEHIAEKAKIHFS